MKKKVLLLLISATALLVSCSDDESLVEPLNSKNSELILEDLDQDGEIVTLETRNGQEVNFMRTSDNVYHLGDMMFSEKQFLEFGNLNNKTVGIASSNYKWPNFTIKYSISSAVRNQSLILQAMSDIESQFDCINFERVNCGNSMSRFPISSTGSGTDNCENEDYIYFRPVPGNTSSSYVGRIGGQQALLVAEKATKGAIIHEIGHALGLYHEHMRYDRDDYLIYHPENVKEGQEGQFNLLSSFGTTVVGDLDFNSIMLYSSFTESNGNGPVLTKLDGSTFTVQRSGFSSGDIEILEEMYYDDSTPQLNKSRVIIDVESSQDTQYVEHRYSVHFKINGNPYTIPSSRVINYSITTKTTNLDGGPNSTEFDTEYFTKILPAGSSSYTLDDVVTIDKVFDYGQPDGPQYERWLNLEANCGDYFID